MGSKREPKRADSNRRRMGGSDRKRAIADGERAIAARERVVERVRRRLLRGGWPRLFISFLLMLTGASGFLTSYALLHLGLTNMAVRYPLAVLAAYCVFLLLLRLWLALRGRPTDIFDGDFNLTGIDLNPINNSGLNLSDAAKIGGGGGDFGGAGAGGGWVADAASNATSSVGNSASLAGSTVGGSTSGGGWNLDLDFDFDADGCALLIIPVIAIVGLAIAMFYVVYAAPVLLAEILVDGLLLAGLYKRLKGVEPRHWLRSAVRRTLLPALLTTALFIAAGYLMQSAIPEARSLGDFWQRAVGNDDKR